MGMIYRNLDKYLSYIDITGIVLEIGSDRHEGSTGFFAEFANRMQMPFHSVDIDPSDAQNRIRYDNINWHKSPGSEWCRDTLPVLNTKISVLYLDNYDYIWNVNEVYDFIQRQQIQYREKLGIELNNKDCQIEHARQMSRCLPYMAAKSLVLLDDTYLHNDCWVGKNGASVVWLQAIGWRILEATDTSLIMTSLTE